MPVDGAPVTVVNDTTKPIGTTDKTTLPSGVSRGGTITTGGQAQTLAGANPARLFLKGQNLSSADLWINEVGGSASASQPSFRVSAGAPFAVNTSNAVSIWGATAGQAFSATEA